MTNIAKGHIVLVNLYDNRYWNIFLDGELVEEPHKESFTQYVLKRSYRQEWAEMAGVKEDDLRYSLIDLYEFEDVIPDYDSNDFGEYSDVINCINKHNIEYLFDKVDLSYIEKKY